MNNGEGNIRTYTIYDGGKLAKYTKGYYPEDAAKKLEATLYFSSDEHEIKDILNIEDI